MDHPEKERCPASADGEHDLEQLLTCAGCESEEELEMTGGDYYCSTCAVDPGVNTRSKDLGSGRPALMACRKEGCDYFEEQDGVGNTISRNVR